VILSLSTVALLLCGCLEEAPVTRAAAKSNFKAEETHAGAQLGLAKKSKPLMPYGNKTQLQLQRRLSAPKTKYREDLDPHCAVFNCTETIGEYIVVFPLGLPVNEKEPRGSPKIASLNEGTKINVVEFGKANDALRVRARIESPAGWISTWKYDKTTAFIVRQAVQPVTIRVWWSKDQCMNAADQKLQTGAKMVVSRNCSDKHFELRSSDNTIRVKSDPELCLSCTGEMGDGSEIQVQPCKANQNQQFLLKPFDRTIRPAAARAQCLSISGGQPKDGARIALWPCNEQGWNADFKADPY
jgi:hypothetical protein